MRMVRRCVPGLGLRAVNKNTQKAASASSQKLHFDDLDPFRITDPLGDFRDLRDDLFFGNQRHLQQTIPVQ